jgi:hypothetical protein
VGDVAGAAKARARRRDRRLRWRIAVAAVCVAAVVAAVLTAFTARLFSGRPRVPPVAAATDGSCAPEQIQSLDTWTLARLDRGPVTAPEKQRWESAIGDAAAVQRALHDRLVGWPARLLADRSALPTDADEFARRLARDTWKGLDALSDREHGLPLDTVAFGPDSVAPDAAHIGDYTSTTNIGLHLIDIVAAQELGFITAEQARERIRRTLATLDRLATDDGAFFNYYDTTSLEPTSHFASSVDTGWLIAGLMVVRMSFPEFYEHCAALIDQTAFGRFYDPGFNLLAHGYFVEPRGPSRYHYGVLYTEARLANLIAIGKGDAPESMWFEMVRTFPSDCRWQTLTPIGVRTKTVLGHELTAGYYEWLGTRYVPSWGGSMFEALMPTLVLDEAALAANSLGANDRAHAFIQMRYAIRELHQPVWGQSPCARPGGDDYAEFGVKLLGSLGYPTGPVTPHASALAIAVLPGASLANLRRLADRYAIYGEYGFYDAVDPASGHVAYKYLTLDQSMLFLSLTNYLTDHAIQRRFAADPITQRVLPLLAAEDFFD